jgi:tight adherence protein B
MVFSPVVIMIGVFVVVTGVVSALALVLRDNASKAGDRLDALVGRRKKEDQGADILRKTAFENDKKSILELITPRLPSLQRLFEQADCNIKANTLIGIGLAIGIGGVGLALLMRCPLFLAPLVGLILFLTPFAWLMNKRRVRLKKFGTQLPEALELVARALRAGHSLAAGMHVVAEESPAPIADEFARVYEEQKLGVSIESSLNGMCERVPNMDLRFFVTSVAIQRQTGGDLAEILDKIGYVIRERFRILGQVKALTGEGRLSGVVLIALPFVLLAVMLWIQPAYVATLWTDPRGIKMSAFALGSQILGAIVIKKIVDIKV